MPGQCLGVRGGGGLEAHTPPVPPLWEHPLGKGGWCVGSARWGAISSFASGGCQQFGEADGICTRASGRSVPALEWAVKLSRAPAVGSGL